MVVTVFSTKGQKKTTVESVSQVWGDLKQDLLNLGIETDGMKAIIGETQLSLESTGAILPDYNFTLFLSPVKVKSGGNVEEYSYKECKDFIKEAVADSAEAKEFFGNYTTKSTTTLRSLISDWLDKWAVEPTDDNIVAIKDLSAPEIIDEIIGLLEVLKGKIETNDVKEEDLSTLSSWWEAIQSNLE